MVVCTIVGARPQFIKSAPLSKAFARENIEEILIHTGQHYDRNMDDVFFEALQIPAPWINLGIGSDTLSRQVARMMMGLDEVLGKLRTKVDFVVVFGDTNSTLASALVASRMGMRLVHVEAGLRSFNRSMPEEANRVVTDHLADLLLCPSPLAVKNLADEGIRSNVHLVGDLMLDAMMMYLPVARECHPLKSLVPFRREEFHLATIHRAENTDDPVRMRLLLDALALSPIPVVWPIHPRSKARLQEFQLEMPRTVFSIEPVGYLEMLSLLDGCCRVLTDSGGLQKEAYWMERPCITLRSETEWKETTEGGWNHVVGADGTKILAALKSDPGERRSLYGSGDAAGEIVRLLAREEVKPLTRTDSSLEKA